ncbi:MAG: hypothetical protein EOP00_04195 [Pedobacter sp.]|nr:MAG: hypothetical protein EOP00_04195 [Pedobacter sp.]
MTLPFYQHFGWHPEIVCVNEKYTDAVFDHLLSESVPDDIKIHYVSALPKKLTNKFGLGSIALRSLWFYRRYVNKLLEKEKFDLIYFSTTQFPVCILGPYWKKKFNIPYIIDMQDPWFSNYYEDKPKHQRPKKYWFSYRIDKYLEPIAMKSVDGLIAVSQTYIEDLKARYPRLLNVPSKVITFGGFRKDLQIASENEDQLRIAFDDNKKYKHIVYVGRGGFDMQKAVHILLSAFKKGLAAKPAEFGKLRFHFIGTSYAPLGQGDKTLYSVAEDLGLEDYVEEETDRISFYESIYNLQIADALFIPGHEQAAYTASKVYPYILCEKPILAIFNPNSSAAQTLIDCKAGIVAEITDSEKAIIKVIDFLDALTQNQLPEITTDWEEFEQYRAKPKTEKACQFFDLVLAKHLKN